MPLSVAQDDQVNQALSEQKTFVAPRRAGTSSSIDSNATRVARSRSADSRSKENDNGVHLPWTRKRKAARLDESTRGIWMTAPHNHSRRRLPRAEVPKRRKHKVAKPAVSTASRSTDDRDGYSASTACSRISSDGLASSTDEETPRRPEWMRSLALRRGKPRNRRASFVEGRIDGHEDIDLLRTKIAELQEELETTRKSATDQMQVIDTLRRELAASKKISRKQGSQIEKLKTSGKKSEDVLNTLQTLLQCQVCLELLLRPFALSPCGHVLCQGCLQEWFRNAPRQPGEDDDGGPLPTIYRTKTCPCCRTEVNRRPTPLFIVKHLVAPFVTESQPPGNSTEVSTSTESDPWAGIFRDDDDDSATEFDEDDPYDTDSDDSIVSRYLPRVHFFSSEEEDHEEPLDDEDDDMSDINYVVPAWAPAFYRGSISRRNYPAPAVSQERFQLLQRGATPQMIERYDMRLDRNHGIVAWTESGIEVYLGWNIARPTGDNPDGERFMDWVENDIADNPQRWRLDEDADHALYRRVIEDYRETEVLGLDEESEDEFDMN